MKAAVFHALKDMRVETVPDPVVNDDSVLLRVRACAVCGSDIRIYNYGNNRITPPQILGHEIAGDVVAVGGNVSKFAVGDRVCTGADIPCGECKPCEAGMGNNCRTNLAMGYQFPGGFAEYVLLERRVVNFGPVHKIPSHLSYAEASLAEPLACAINGLEMTGLNPGETVVVIGAGPIGLMLVEMAKFRGAGKVIVVQRSKARMELAKAFGADVVTSPLDEDPVERVMAETDGEGADVIFTATSSLETQEQAYRMLTFRGRLNLFGGLPAGSDKLCIDSNLLHYREALMTGSHGSVPRQHGLALDLIAKGCIDAKKYISAKYDLDHILDALTLAGEHQVCKVIIEP